MSGRSVHVQKFKVFINGTERPDIISVDGISLGEEGTVEVSEQGLAVDVSDGRRKLKALILRFQKKRGLKTFTYFHDWWKNRHTEFRDISIVFYDKGYTEELHRYYYKECEMHTWNEDTQDRSDPKIAQVECSFLPYDGEIIEI